MSKRGSTSMSTGEVARRLDVKPDTVLKWIKRGLIPAWTTAGGHHRIDARQVEELIHNRRKHPGAGDAGRLVHCWEFLAGEGDTAEECLRCVVYRVRAERCFEFLRLGLTRGHEQHFCRSTCEDCPYYLQLNRMPLRVLVVTADRRFVQKLTAADPQGVTIRVANNLYEAARSVGEFLPALVVIDGDLPEKDVQELACLLAEDARIPWAKVLVTGGRGEHGALENLLNSDNIIEALGRKCAERFDGS